MPRILHHWQRRLRNFWKWLSYANQENNEDDDSSIQYQVLLFFQRDWLWVNSEILIAGLP